MLVAGPGFRGHEKAVAHHPVIAFCACTMANAFRARADLTDIPSPVSVTSKADTFVQEQSVAQQQRLARGLNLCAEALKSVSGVLTAAPKIVHPCKTQTSIRCSLLQGLCPAVRIFWFSLPLSFAVFVVSCVAATVVWNRFWLRSMAP